MVFSHSNVSLYKAILLIGLPLVHAYHMLCGNIFLNVASTDANFIERCANTLLAPAQYIFVGRTAHPTSNSAIPYHFENTFDYQDFWVLKTLGSAALITPSLAWGSLVKGLAYLKEDTRQRNREIQRALENRDLHSNVKLYRSVGIDINEDIKNVPRALTHSYPRSPKDRNNLHEDKKALKNIIAVLEKENIPYWADCGTCLGAYRHAGVIPWDNDIDIAVLEPDFENVRHALSSLDPKKYAVLDWSSRDKPNTFLKVYVKNTDILIDIYHYRIDPENKTLNYILSNEDNIFLGEAWRKRERHYKKPVPFDMIFPLSRAAFDDVELLVPNKIEEYLKVRYGENLAPIKVYNPETDQYEEDLSHPYWQFMENSG